MGGQAVTDDVGGAENSAMMLHFELTSILREETGLKEELASRIATLVLRGLRRKLGPGRVYIPGPDRTEFYKEVLKDFNGRNHQEVMDKYGISRSTLHRLFGQRAG